MYKYWVTFIKPYVIVPYKTVGMLVNIWYHKKENMTVWKVVGNPK